MDGVFFNRADKVKVQTVSWLQGRLYSDFVPPASARRHVCHSVSRPASSQMSHPSRSLNHVDISFVKIHVLIVPKKPRGCLVGINSARV